MPAWTYQLRYVRCGKPRCRCAGGRGHGPYWYGFSHRGGRVTSKYVGKVRPGWIHDDPKAPAPHIPERWRFDGRMNGAVALRILGFAPWPSADELRVRFRTLMMSHHPDHGGDVEIAKAINAAHQYMKAHANSIRSPR